MEYQVNTQNFGSILLSSIALGLLFCQDLQKHNKAVKMLHNLCQFTDFTISQGP